MIKEVSGDILFSRADLLAHGISAQDPFDSGLALALRERWPSLVRDFRHHTRSRAVASGDVWFWTGIQDGGGTRKILNLITQDTLGQGSSAKPAKASIENVRRALQNLAKLVKQENISSVALPRLATGVGSLPWSEVSPLIRQYLGDLGIPVIVYTTYRKGEMADEGL